MTENKLDNPLSKIGLWLIVIFIGFFAATSLADLNDIQSLFALPLGFFCSLYFSLWISFQFRTGRISLVSQSGTTSTYTRKENPILFFLIITTGFVFGVFLTIALGSDLFLSCESSLINSCPLD